MDRLIPVCMSDGLRKLSVAIALIGHSQARVSRVTEKVGRGGAIAHADDARYNSTMRYTQHLTAAFSSMAWYAFARSLLYVSCQVLFMDEPTAAVDAGAKRHLWKALRMSMASEGSVR